MPARFSINSIARLQDCTRPTPIDARLTLYPRAGHDAWTRTYDPCAGYDIYRWLIRYRKELTIGRSSRRLQGAQVADLLSSATDIDYHKVDADRSR